MKSLISKVNSDWPYGMFWILEVPNLSFFTFRGSEYGFYAFLNLSKAEIFQINKIQSLLELPKWQF